MKKVVAVTSCPVGIAHTYMAAENLEKAGEKLGVTVKVETHGSIGVENELSAQDIQESIGVIIAADTKIDTTRFAGKPIEIVSVQDGIYHAEDLISKLLSEKVETLPIKDTPVTKERKAGNNVYKSLMNGVSYMVPFVVTGGLLIAISLTLGGTPTAKGIKIPAGTIWSTINSIGSVSMGMMIPILSAFISQSIADRPGLVPGFIGGMLAANGTLYGSNANAGFLGGIITGFLAGFVALAIKKIRVPKTLQSIMPIIIIPIISSLIVGFLFIYVIGGPVAFLFSSLTKFLVGMQGGSKVVLAMILGAMIAFDMGGPFNKVAFLFGSGLIVEGNYSIMGPIAVAICIPPLSLGVATFVLKTKFSKPEKEAGKASFLMGLFGITEGAIPFASSDPLRVIPSIMIGSMVGSILAMLAGVTDHVAHGGPIVAVLGAVDHVVMFFLSVLLGIIVVVLLLKVFKPTINKESIAVVDGGNLATNSEEKTAQSTAISDIVTTDLIILDTPITTKEKLINEMVERLQKADMITDFNQFKQAIYDREAQGATGIGMGIAIPHGKSRSVKKPTVVFARSKQGINWESLDGKPANLIFMIAVPAESEGDLHLKILQKLSRKLMDDQFRENLMAEQDKNKIKQLLSEN